MSDANLLLLGVQLFPESNAQLLAQTLELLEVLLVLVLALDLGLDTYISCVSDWSQLIYWQHLLYWFAHTLEDTDGSGEVVDTAGSLQGRAEDLNGGDEIVGEAVVQVALEK
jgi:hypothetical protein